MRKIYGFNGKMNNLPPYQRKSEILRLWGFINVVAKYHPLMSCPDVAFCDDRLLPFKKKQGIILPSSCSLPL
jgi:hypothetical protein